MAYVSRTFYIEIIRDFNTRLHKENVHFLTNNLIFKDCNVKDFQTHLYKYFVYESNERGYQIISEGYRTDWVYFLHKGTFEIRMNKTTEELSTFYDKMTSKRFQDKWNQNIGGKIIILL